MRRLWGPAPERSLGILGFHNLTPTPAQPHVAAAFPRRFQRLCRLLASRYEVVTVSEGFRRLEADESRDRPLVAIIFDDGYADVHHTALPILLEEGLTATSYVVVNCLTTGEIPWYENLGRLVFSSKSPRFEFDLDGDRRGWDLAPDPARRDQNFVEIVRALKTSFTPAVPERVAEMIRAEGLEDSDSSSGLMMNASQARDLVAAGLEVGCHSMSHPILPQLDEDALRYEIIESRNRLAGLLDHEVTSFCYPNGDNDERCIAMTREAGYDCAVSMTCGANLTGKLDSHLLKRIPVSEDINWLWPFHTVYRIHSTFLEEVG